MQRWPWNVRTTLLAAAVIAVACAPPEGAPREDEPTREADAPLVAKAASMANARFRHSTTKLANGKVLVMGGAGTSASSSAELFDPATGAWSPTGAPLTARSSHQAVLLDDGTVLAMGGTGSSSVLSSAERYDPSTGTWSAAAPMNHAAWDFTATKLQDGRVLVTGGCPSPYSAVAEIFNPSTGTWSLTGSMTKARCGHQATLLADGRVLITGGTYLQQDSNQAEIYDPATGVFTATAPASQTKDGSAAVRMADGRVLCLSNDSSTANEIYDPATNLWFPAPQLEDQRVDQVAVLLPDGSVLVAGDEPSSIERLSQGAWSVVGHTSGERHNPGVAVLDDGRILLVGGWRDNWVSCGTGCWTGTPVGMATAELYTHDLTKLSSWNATYQVPACLSVQSECDSLAFLYGRGSVLLGAETNAPNTINDSCPDGNSGYGYSDELIQSIRVQSQSGGPLQAGTTAIVQVEVSPSISVPDSDLLDIYRAADATSPSWTWVTTLALNPAKPGLQVLSAQFTLPNGSLQAVRGVFRRGGSAAPCTTGSYDDHDDLVFAVAAGTGGDLTPPTVSITSPAAGSINNGTVQLSATASDDVGVTKVEWWNGSTLIFTSATPPYGVTWGAPGGSVTVTAKAYDAAGNVGSSSVTFTSDRTNPTVSITAPANGSTVSGTVTVSASASDNISVARVDFYMGTTLIGSDTTAPYGVSWSSAGWDGSRTFKATAVDSVGNSASSTVTVTVDNGGGPDTLPPSVTITSPASGAPNTGTMLLSADATDNVGVTKVEWWNGSTLIYTDTAAPYSVYWGAPPGQITVTAKAYDAAGNIGTASVTFGVDQTAPTVSITAPANGSTVSGTVTVSANASDDVGVARVDFYMGSTLIGSDTTAPYGVAWNTVGQDGSRSLSATARDAAGNVSTTSVQVTVNNGGGGGLTLATYDSALRTASCRAAGAGCDSGNLFNGRAQLGPELNAPNTINGSCADGTAGTYHSDESMDRLRVYSASGSLQAGHAVTIEATVWAWSGYSYDHLDLYSAADATNPSWTYLATLTPSGAGTQVMTATYTLPAGGLQAVRAQFRYGGTASPCTADSFNDRDDLAFAVSP